MEQKSNNPSFPICKQQHQRWETMAQYETENME